MHANDNRPEPDWDGLYRTLISYARSYAHRIGVRDDPRDIVHTILTRVHPRLFPWAAMQQCNYYRTAIAREILNIRRDTRIRAEIIHNATKLLLQRTRRNPRK